MKELKAIQSSEIVCDETGRQYHINLAPGELAEHIILVGDPDRVGRAAKMLTNVRIQQKNREFTTVTGDYKGLEVSIMGTGIGTDNTEIALFEIFQITKSPTLIRVGTCGGLQEDINPGDVVISTGAMRLENTSTFYVPENYPAVANYEVNLALLAACEELKVNYHMGLTATASGFYGAQGRKLLGIPLRMPNLREELTEMQIANCEMEASLLFTLAQLRKVRASAICMVVNNRIKDNFITPEDKVSIEQKSLTAGLNALKTLDRIDREKAKQNKKYWVPTL